MIKIESKYGGYYILDDNDEKMIDEKSAKYGISKKAILKLIKQVYFGYPEGEGPMISLEDFVESELQWIVKLHKLNEEKEN